MMTKLMILSGCFGIGMFCRVNFINFDHNHSVQNTKFQNLPADYKTFTANVGYRKKVQYTAPDHLTDEYYDNDRNLFIDGYTKEYYYDLVGSYGEGNLDFTISSAGAMSLIEEYRHSPSSWKTGKTIMDWLNHQLKHFDDLFASSYLNRIEGNATLPGGQGIYKDSDAYNDFENHLGQPASIVYSLNKLYSQGKVLPAVAVRFHYNYHDFAKDDFDVSFTLTDKPIWDALRQFTDKKPVLLDYIQPDPIKASDTKATDALRSDLVKQDKTKTITPDIAVKITFGDDEIKVDQTVKVIATYERETVPIWVRERDNKKDVLDFLKKKFAETNPVSFVVWPPCKDYADQAAQVIRKSILKQANAPVITPAVVNGISFDHQKMPLYKKFLLVIHYKGLTVKIYAYRKIFN